MYKQIIYKDSIQNSVQRLSDGATIPFDLANTDYQAFTRWLNDGNIPLPADEGQNNGEVIK